MMPSQSQSQLRDNFLDIAGYLTIAAVAVAGSLEMEKVLQRWQAVILLLVFAALFRLTPERTAGHKWQAILTLSGQTLVVIMLLVLHPSSTTFTLLFFILSATAMVIYPLKPALLWVALFSLITIASEIIASGELISMLSVLPYLGGYFFFGFFAHTLYQARQVQAQSDELLGQLQSANFRLQEYASQVETLIASQERNRLAREMHDTIGHRLTVAAVQLEGAQRLVHSQPERAESMVGTVRAQVREALAELRQTVAALRQPLEADLNLRQALVRLAESFQTATGLQVHIDLAESLPELTQPQHLAFFRVAQEGLTNVQRHANASQVWLSLSRQAGRLALLVRDDGRGTPPAISDPPENLLPTGFGLRGLQERAAQLNGECWLESLPEGGMQLSFWIPTIQENAFERED